MSLCCQNITLLDSVENKSTNSSVLNAYDQVKNFVEDYNEKNKARRKSKSKIPDWLDSVSD